MVCIDATPQRTIEQEYTMQEGFISVNGTRMGVGKVIPSDTCDICHNVIGPDATPIFSYSKLGGERTYCSMDCVGSDAEELAFLTRD